MNAPNSFDPRLDDIDALRSLIAGHGGALARSESRIGAIIRAFRPSRHVSHNPLFDPGEAPRDFATDALLARIDQLARTCAPSVGCIEVADDEGEWIPVATCFRVGRAGRLVASSGHALEAFLKRGCIVVSALPFDKEGDLRAARVNFDAFGRQDREDSIFPIGRVRACHSRWDLMICDVEDRPGSPPLPPSLELETDIGWGAAQDNGVVVLGFPAIEQYGDHVAFSQVFGDLPGIGLHAAPGKLWRPTDGEDFVLPLTRDFKTDRVNPRHDASTLRGNSGSPVISLDSGKVVALHFAGGSFISDPDRQSSNINKAVNLPVALREERLVAAMLEGSDDALIGAIQRSEWTPGIPRWKPLDRLTQLESAWSTVDDPTQAPFSGVVPDRPDFRDYIYSVGLAPMPDRLDPPRDPQRLIRDQGYSRACTGFALAAAIDQQLAQLGRRSGPVSARMLYEMAQMHDEWIDRPDGGSSLRGAIKGFYQNGVCAEASAPWRFGEQQWFLTRDRTREARHVTLGAYFRIPPELLAFQSALRETGSIIVSAHIHKGWERSARRRVGKIPYRKGSVGAHAFVLVGYDEEGFIIQNSWGPDWSVWNGQAGLAHWSYTDWAENLIDAWVLRLAPGQPKTFDLRARAALAAGPAGSLALPRRHALLGHIAHTENHGFVRSGPLGTGLEALRETALYLATDEARRKYTHIAFFVHDPFLGPEAAAATAGSLIGPLKARGVYALHLLHGLDEVETIRLRILMEAERIMARYGAERDALSAYIARRAGAVTSSLWSRFLSGCLTAASRGGPIWKAIASILIEAGENRRIGLCTIGAGANIAESMFQAGTFEDLGVIQATRMFVAPTLPEGWIPPPGPGRSLLCRLSASRPEAGSIAGYRGDWPDLVLDAYIHDAGLARAGTAEKKTNGFSAERELTAQSVASAFGDTTLRKLALTALSNRRAPRRGAAPIL